MHIASHGQAQFLGPGIGPPALGKRDEEALVRSKAVRRILSPAARRQLVGLVGKAQAAGVGDVFAQRLVAVDMHAGKHLVPVVQFRNPLGPHLEAAGIGIGPPVLQVALPVILPALVVEAMGEFMADGRGERAVIVGVTGALVEEGGLQDARRQDDLVQRPVIVGVVGLRRDASLVAVDGLPEL